MTGTELKSFVESKGLQIDTVIPNDFEEIEYLAITLKFGVTAFFLMDNQFEYSYSHTYNALTDKTYKRNPIT